MLDSIEEERNALAPAQIMRLYGAIVEPRFALVRIRETVKRNTRSVSIISEYTFNAAALGAERAIIPLALFPHHQLQDGLNVELNGENVAVVTRLAFVTHAVAVIERLILTAYADAPRAQAVLTPALRTDIIQLVRGSYNGENSVDADTVISRLIHNSAPQEPSRTRYLQMASNLLKVLSGVAPLCVQFSPGQVSPNMLVTFRVIQRVYTARRTQSRQLLTAAAYHRVRDGLRNLFGINPNPLVFPLTNAERCQSYHLEIEGPPGTFLARQRVVDLHGREVDMDSSFRYSLRARLGQRHAHLYMRSGRLMYDKVFTPLFYERLPGSMMGAGLSAIAATLVVWLSAAVKLGATSHADVHTDLVLLALSFPPIIAAWAGVSAEGPGTLMARLSTVLTIGASMAAAVLYVVQSDFDKDHYSDHAYLDRPYFFVWSGIVALASINLLVTGSTLVMRAAVYRKLSTPRSDK